MTTVEWMKSLIRDLPVEERKEIMVDIFDSLSGEDDKPSLFSFRGVGAHNGETETNPNDYLGVFYAKTSIKDRLDFKSSLHKRDVDAQEYVNQLRQEWDDRP